MSANTNSSGATPGFAGRQVSTLSRLVSSLTVRTRIAVIALLPLAGFVANGAAFMTGEAAVDRAFDSVKAASVLNDASRNFKDALARMRVAAADFSRDSRPVHIRTFNDAHAVAAANLARIHTHRDNLGGRLLPNVGEPLQTLKVAFDKMLGAQEAVGFGDNQGIRAQLQEAIRNAEEAASDLSWLTREDAQSLAIGIATLRRHQLDHMLGRTEKSRKEFLAEMDAFNAAVDKVVAPDVMKSSVRDTIRLYGASFADWMTETAKVATHLDSIDNITLDLMHRADSVIALAGQQENLTAETLSASQAKTRNIIVGVGVTAILLGLFLSWLIGLSIIKPLKGLAGVMKSLANGDTAVDIPGVRLKDEIGDMARTVIVFRDRMIERESLAAAQGDESRKRERRAEAIATTIGRFENSVDAVLSKVRAAAQKLETSSGNLNGTANAMTAEARQAEGSVAAASENVTASASSVEELAASISEIAAQANKSTAVASRAVEESRRTAQTMSELGGAATRIGEVVNLIQAIAGQTNLLALNATIEAARAGEAGRGFAVVASEVKSLAGQTGKATEDIAGQIGAIQSAAGDAVEAITQVNAIIEEMSMIAASVAMTVEEQNSAVASISEGVHKASMEARSGAQAMSRVAGASQEAHTTAADVKSLADTLAIEAEELEAEVRRFLAEVRAA